MHYTLHGCLCALALLAAGCATPVDQNSCDSIIDVGTENSPVGALVDNGQVWSTSNIADPDAPRVQYLAYSTYRVWHGLGHVPYLGATVWTAFDAHGILAQQIGNVAELLPTCNGAPGITDHYVLLRNAGGQDFQAVIQIQ